MFPGCLTHYHVIIKHSSSIYNPLALLAAIASLHPCILASLHPCIRGRKDSFANARVIVYCMGLQICRYIVRSDRK